MALTGNEQQRQHIAWNRIRWNRPPEAITCSYCDAPLVEENVPLVLHKDDRTATFCCECSIAIGAEIILSAEPPPEPPSITCLRCRMTSYHPTDIAEGWCAKCHDWTGR